jgi:hypothetical protein
LGACSALAFAPHPSVLTVKYDGQMLPVVKVSGDTPYVLVKGELQSVKSEPIYLIQDASGFSSNFVTAASALGGEFQLTPDSDRGIDPDAVLDGYINFEFPPAGRQDDPARIRRGCTLYLRHVFAPAAPSPARPGHRPRHP